MPTESSVLNTCIQVYHILVPLRLFSDAGVNIMIIICWFLPTESNFNSHFTFQWLKFCVVQFVGKSQVVRGVKQSNMDTSLFLASFLLKSSKLGYYISKWGSKNVVSVSIDEFCNVRARVPVMITLKYCKHWQISHTSLLKFFLANQGCGLSPRTSGQHAINLQKLTLSIENLQLVKQTNFSQQIMLKYT